MAYDVDQREIEVRKLEALSAISIAIAALGSGLASMVKEHAEQGQLLKAIDQKLDRLIHMIAGLKAS